MKHVLRIVPDCHVVTASAIREKTQKTALIASYIHAVIMPAIPGKI
jgi:hypothetical protein